MNVSQARKKKYEKNHCLHMKIGVDSCYVFHNIGMYRNMYCVGYMYLVSEFEIPDNFSFLHTKIP